MRVVIALSYSPYPVSRGTDRLIINLIRGLSRKHEVKLVTMSLDSDSIERLKELENERVSVEAIVAPHRRSFLHRLFHKARVLLIAAIRGVPMQSAYASPPSYIELVVETCRRWNADLTIVNYWHLERLAGMIDTGRVALLTHDLDFMNYNRRIETAGSRIGRLFSRIRFRPRAELEIRAYNSFSRILTVTEKEARDLRDYLQNDEKIIEPLPMAIDLEKFEFNPELREENTVLLLGVFYTDFNRDSLQYFIESILPRIVSSKPDVRFEVIGPGVPSQVADILGKRGKVRGMVDDIRVYMQRCSVMALPLRFAAGVRIRMLEAAASGMPVVSTATGVSGIDVMDGREYLNADTPEEFASAVVRILEDSEFARRIGKNAREWAVENISLSSYPARLEKTIGTVLKPLS